MMKVAGCGILNAEYLKTKKYIERRRLWKQAKKDD